MYAPNANRHPLDDPRYVRAFLDQSDAWCDATLAYQSIASMEPGHALNTVNFLLNSARKIALAHTVGGNHNDIAIALDKGWESPGNGGVIPLRDMLSSDVIARCWLLGTQLVQSLLRRATAQAPVSGLPWEQALAEQSSSANKPFRKIAIDRPYYPPQDSRYFGPAIDDADGMPF